MKARARERAIAQGFNPKDLDLAEQFVHFVANLLQADRRNAAPLRRGIGTLATKLNTLVPEFEERGETEPLPVSDLAAAMEPLSGETIAEFSQLAGLILLTSQDGPLGAAPAMKRVIDELEEHRDGRVR
jgi:hypothetical protein